MLLQAADENQMPVEAWVERAVVQYFDATEEART